MKTIEQKAKEVKDYVNNASQHLFISDDTTLFKIIPYTKDGIDYCAKIMINTKTKKVAVKSVRTNMIKGELKHELFPTYVKTKSIPYFKKMREIIAKVTIVDGMVTIPEIEKEIAELELV
jgi:hypothetical protein